MHPEYPPASVFSKGHWTGFLRYITDGQLPIPAESQQVHNHLAGCSCQALFDAFNCLASRSLLARKFSSVFLETAAFSPTGRSAISRLLADYCFQLGLFARQFWLFKVGSPQSLRTACKEPVRRHMQQRHQSLLQHVI